MKDELMYSECKKLVLSVHENASKYNSSVSYLRCHFLQRKVVTHTFLTNFLWNDIFSRIFFTFVASSKSIHAWLGSNDL